MIAGLNLWGQNDKVSSHYCNLLTGDVNRACQGHVSLSNSTEESAVVNQPSDAVVHHNLPQVLVVQDV